MEKMIVLDHSPLGGSSAHRFINCEYSFRKHRENIEAGDNENITSEFAEKGTGAHELGASCLGLGTEPYEHLGEKFNGFLAGWPGGIALDAVSVYVTDCRRIMDSAGSRPSRTLVEETIRLPEIHPLFKGTVDFGHYALDPTTPIYLRDYKNGEGIGVAAPNNEQLLYYAGLFILADPTLRDGPQDREVSLGIVQPNFYGIFSEPDIWVTTVGHVLDWIHDVLLPRMEYLSESQRIAAAELPDNSMVPGDWCQFCPVLLECRKMQAAFKSFVDAPEDYEVIMLSNEELDLYYSQRAMARRFMNTLETTVHHRLVTGGDFANAKLVEKQVARVWKPGATPALVAKFGEKAYTERAVKSPAAIEKLSSEGKSLALEFGYKPESAGLSVAGMEDRRPAVKPRSNASVFAGHIPIEKPIDTAEF